ncbi:hypothetical protein V6260_08785 [Pseudoalteromonas aliena]
MFINTPKLEKLTSKKIADNTFLIWLAVCRARRCFCWLR